MHGSSVEETFSEYYTRISRQHQRVFPYNQNLIVKERCIACPQFGTDFSFSCCTLFT